MSHLRLRQANDISHDFEEIIGCSGSLLAALELVERVAPTTASVLITGETGTGKELMARAIHRKSERRDEALVKVNCASVPKELFESEFFGHVKGSFTGAIRNRIGRFELANEGTIFLDEVCEIPIDLQSKLLRVLQEREFERVGEETSRRVDVRVIAATNRDPHEEIKKGRFREDLFFRLNVVPITVPPLRERWEDVPLLAERFLNHACQQFGRGPFSLDEKQRQTLLRYSWPGNVRELRNMIERAVALSTSELIDLTDCLTGAKRADRVLDQSGYLTDEEFREFEKANISTALKIARWQIAGDGGAAELLGIPASTLANRLRSLGITKPDGHRLVGEPGLAPRF